jgi:hypothetical protein
MELYRCRTKYEAEFSEQLKTRLNSIERCRLSLSTYTETSYSRVEVCEAIFIILLVLRNLLLCAVRERKTPQQSELSETKTYGGREDKTH